MIEPIAAVRDQAPLVHCISAAVSFSIVADGLLAAGARPMMTETAAEAPVLVGVADALLVNLGTLSTDGAAGIPPTVDAARVPWVLDPAAVGPTRTRRELAAALLAHGPAVIRANASEVLVLAGAASAGRGPDATATVAEAGDAALRLAAVSGAVVAVSGEKDLLAAPDGRCLELANGSPLLSRIVGTGCLLGALTAERAARRSRGPATFRTELLDELYAITPEQVANGSRTRWI